MVTFGHEEASLIQVFVIQVSEVSFALPSIWSSFLVDLPRRRRHWKYYFSSHLHLHANRWALLPHPSFVIWLNLCCRFLSLYFIRSIRSGQEYHLLEKTFRFCFARCATEPDDTGWHGFDDGGCDFSVCSRMSCYKW